MWIMRRSPSKQAAPPSENIQPSIHRAFSRQDDQLDLNNQNQQIQKITQIIVHHKPISQFVDIDLLSVSPNLQIKRYKQSVFWGEMRENKRNGIGIMLYLTGRMYEGEWENNYKQGKGFQKFSNGSVYKGSYVQGKPEGCGRYEWENGEIYQGEWKSGVKHGSGIWRGSKGDSYIGQWQEGKAQGYGVHTWTNGDRYQGQFKDCLKHGEGVQKFANGDTYKGMYQTGKPSGYGQYYWASGSFFKGQFKAGLRNGQGVWKRGPGRSDKFQGQWKNDKKQGYGVFTWGEGNIYKGDYVNDIREGYGQMYWIDGNVFKGTWKNDQQIQQQSNNNEQDHDEQCQLFVPTKLTPEQDFYLDSNIQQFYGRSDENQFNVHPYYNMPQTHLYNEPQRPAILKPAPKQIRPRNFTRQSVRSDQRSRVQSQTTKTGRGLNKKMSVGTVAGKDLYKQQSNRDKKSMSSSFFLYKIHGGDTNRSKQQITRKQIRTSGANRAQNYVEEELKYFARSKLGSHSQLH